MRQVCRVSVQPCEQRLAFFALACLLASILLLAKKSRTPEQYWGLWPPWFTTFVLVFLFVVYFWVL